MRNCALLLLCLTSTGCLALADPPILTDDMPDTGWRAVAVDTTRVFALHDDGSLWVGAPGRLTRSGTGYVALSSYAGGGGACVVRSDGSLDCGTFDLPGPFDGVSGAPHAGCAYQTGGSARCWPETAPGGVFESIGAGDRFACGIRTTSSLRCWSIDDLILDDALTSIPAGSYSEVQTADSIACARGMDGAVVCWGDDMYGITGFLPGSHVDLAMNRYNACAVRSDGSVHCWGDGAADPNNGHLFPPSDVAFVDVELGYDIGCGLTTDSRLVCW